VGSDAPRPKVQVYGARPSEAASASPIMSAVIVGVALAIAWTLLVYVTHNPVSLAGWGVGGLIGIVLARAGRRGETTNASRGTVAIVLTVGTVLLAKALILAFALRPIVRDEVVRSPEARTAFFMIDMTVHRSFSPDLQAELDKEAGAGAGAGPGGARDTAFDPRRLERAFELRERIVTEARARDSAATPAERERIVRTYADSLLGSQPFLPMLGRLFGLWDLLWLGLGASSAWKLAQIGTG
jgi:phosphate/sulfate permease